MKKIEKIMLISPPSLAAKDNIRRLIPPLGLLYLGGVLKEEDYKVSILDSSAEGYNNLTQEDENFLSYGLSKKNLTQRLLDFNPDLVGIGSPFSSRHKKSLEISNTIRENLDVPIVLGGLHASLIPQELLKSGVADYVILGEAETNIRNLVKSLNNGAEPDFNGIAHLRNGKAIVNGVYAREPDLDRIPFPARDLIDMEKYFEVALPIAPYSRSNRVAQLYTSRGCPAKCNFCSTVNFWGRDFRGRSVENVISEVEHLVEDYGVEELQIIDDNLTVDRPRALELFKRLEDFNLYWCAPNGIMLQTLNQDVLEAMGRSGAYQISVAVESGSERVRKEIIHKVVPRKEKVRELVNIARDNEIQTHGLFVLGFPGETKEEIYQTLDYPFDIGFDSVSYFIATPLPGSELYEECLVKGYILKQQSNSFRVPEIRIPKDSPDYYGIEPEELEKLIDQRTKDFNDRLRQRNPEAWRIKYDSFLRHHPEEKSKILGRIQ